MNRSTGPQLPPQCHSFPGQHSFALYSLAQVSNNLGLLKQEVLREVRRDGSSFFCILPNFTHEIQVFLSAFDLSQKHCVWGALGQWRASLGNKGPIAFPQEFQGFGACCGFSSSLYLHCTSFGIKWHLSNHHRIIQPGLYCCYLYSWFPFKMAMIPLLAHREDSYFLSSGKPREKNGKKRVINLMQI